MILSFHIVLIFLIFNSASAADLSFFTDEDDDVPLFLDPSSVDEDIFSDAADTNIFTVNLNFPDQDLLLSSDFLLSSCLLDETFQPALQARGGGADCKTTPSSPLTIPSLPTLNDIENTLEPNPNQPGGPEKNRPTGPYLVIQVPHQGELGANEPEYYCNLYVTPYYPPAPFTIPVCGVGDASDRFGSRGFLYSVVDRARILFPVSGWECPESEFFCCQEINFDNDDNDETLPPPPRSVVEYDDYRRMVESGRFSEAATGEEGQASECRNLKEAGWKGYDSDREGAFQVVDPADLGIQDP